MALFAPYKILSSKLNSLPIEEGQIIFTTDTKEIYIDIDNSTRTKLYTDSVKSVSTNGNFLSFNCESEEKGSYSVNWQSNSVYTSRQEPKNMNIGDIWIVTENNGVE